MSKVLIIGSGMMGSALSRPLFDHDPHCEIHLVGTPLDTDIIAGLRAKPGWHCTLKRQLPDAVIPHNYEELPALLADPSKPDFIINGVSSFGVEWFIQNIIPVLPDGIPVLSVTKGIHAAPDGACIVFPKLLEDARKAAGKAPLEFNAIGGPCTSYELADRHQTMVYFCGPNRKTLETLRAFFATPYYHVSLSTDVLSVEICVALKNAFAVGISIAVGIAEKLDGPTAYQYNPQAALFGQAMREMRRVLTLLGGNPDMAADLPGAGDLYVTVFGGRTRRLGRLLGLGESYAQAKAELAGVTLESVAIITAIGKAFRARAAQGTLRLADYPLLMHLDEVINHGAPATPPWDKF